MVPDLMETLVAMTDGRGLDEESIHTSVYLEQTVDGKTLFHGSVSEAVGADQVDLQGLPVRELVDPGVKADDHTDYRLVGALGRGGTGIVFQAHQRAVNREVAIKVLRNELRQDPAARKRFLDEARTVGALDHPNVIALHELALDPNGHLFYSMKRIDGTAWSEVIGEHSLESNLDILNGVADAIRYAHSRGIVHRDIKPANVMLGRYGEVLVADWGLALATPVTMDLTNVKSSIGGTPAYMAPEIALGDLTEIGPQTDIYLLGATLFNIVTGFPPHEGETLVECVYNAALNRIRETEIDDELLDIAYRAMRTDPQDRYESVDAFQQAIRDYLQHQESNALVRRALSHTKADQGDLTYEKIGLAIWLIREALELWPENKHATRTLKSLQLQFAELAFDQDDLDLASSLLEAAKKTDSPLGKQIQERRAQRSAQIRREERYSMLFANSPDAVLVSRCSDGTILDANESFERVFKHTRDEVVGSRVADINLWECIDRRVDFISQVRKSGKVDNFETTLKTKEGKLVPVLISARLAELNNETLLVAHTRDITKRREAEMKLRRSRSKLRQVQRLAQLGTWEYNVESGEITWSDETFRMFGMPADSTPPSLEEYLALVHASDRPKLEAALHDAVSNGAAYQLQVRHRRTDGKYNHMIARGQPITDNDGRVTELFGSVLDISDRKQIEDRLKAHARSLQSILDFSGKPLLALDHHGRLLAAAQSILQALDRKACCLEREILFRPLDASSLEDLVSPTTLRGQFFEDGNPLGPEMELRLDPDDDLLRCELVV